MTILLFLKSGMTDNEVNHAGYTQLYAVVVRVTNCSGILEDRFHSLRIINYIWFKICRATLIALSLVLLIP